MTQLYLIRHGQAYCNVDNVLAGMKSDTGLTPFGVRQAERLRDRLAATGEIAADVLIASTLPRARQTAEILAPVWGLPILPDDDVQELRVGEVDGMTWDEYVTQFGPPPDFRQAPFQPIFKGGETWGEFVLRVGRTLYRIAQEYEGKTVVVVCHGGVIDASFLICLGMSMVALPPAQFHTRNTSMTAWERYAYGEEQHWRLVRYNDDLHTRDLDAPKRLGWVRLNPEPPAYSDQPAAPVPIEPTSEEAAASAAE